MQYITNLQIVNKALAKLGLREIDDLNGQEESARVANNLFGSVRDYELATYPWAFAIKRASLPALADTPAFGYKFQYALPEDFLRLEGIYNQDILGRDAYDLEGNTILTNLKAPLLIRYISRNLDQTKWPPYFVEAFACRLAYEMCERLKQDPSRKNTLMQEYQLVIAAAKRSNAIQLAIKELKPTSWEAAHG